MIIIPKGNIQIRKKKKKKGMPYGSIYKVYAALGQGNKNLEYHVRLTCKGALHCFISN